MADRRPIHTVPTHEGWANKREGSDRVSRRFRTKADAERAGRSTARRDGAAHVSHRTDGTVGERRSYEKVPAPSRG
jgi:hypothetical protein